MYIVFKWDSIYVNCMYTDVWCLIYVCYAVFSPFSASKYNDFVVFLCFCFFRQKNDENVSYSCITSVVYLLFLGEKAKNTKTQRYEKVKLVVPFAFFLSYFRFFLPRTLKTTTNAFLHCCILRRKSENSSYACKHFQRSNL